MVDYGYSEFRPEHSDGYLRPVLKRLIRSHDWPDKRAFDLGCGNGSTCRYLEGLGFSVVGVDSSASGVAIARGQNLNVHEGSCYDDLAARYGQFPLVISLEVIEHLLAPRDFVRTFVSLIAPGGLGVISTPYHGYFKNLALAVTGKMDAHFTALWDGGHIKFFSVRTLGAILQEAGATDISFERVGRIPQLAKSMLAVIRL
jgi:2-polyprenyl-3-methyl-5-hydroxy-6-metoxy-1,4-benzoquinol methylase